MQRLTQQIVYRMGLDFSNLSKPIVTSGYKNYRVPNRDPSLEIDGYMTDNFGVTVRKMHSVIMIHEWWGFNKSMCQTAELFANENIQVFVPDLYRGQPAIDAEVLSIIDFQEAGHKMDALNWPKALEDIKRVKQHLEKDPDTESVSIVGYCMGGALSFASCASIEGFKVGGVFYGIPDLNIFRLDRLKNPVIGHFGRLDPLTGFSDAASAEKLANDALSHNYDLKIMQEFEYGRIYENCSHAFCNQDSKYFNEESRNLAFDRTRELIQKVC